MTTKKSVILVVEDDKDLSTLLTAILESEGYEVISVVDGRSALELVDKRQPDLILLELILPDVDGLVLISDLKILTNAPVMVCTGSGRRRDKELSLMLGASAVLFKPFDISDLAETVGKLLQSPETPPEPPKPESDTLRFGNLVVSKLGRIVTIRSIQLDVTPIEYRILKALVAANGQPISFAELARSVWGYSDEATRRAVRVHINRVRTTLQSRDKAPRIISVRGVGYKLESDNVTIDNSPP